MEISSPTRGVDTRGPHSTPRSEAELARLRAQVSWLQAERAALWWAVGHDELTGLANRRLFNTVAPALLREPDWHAAVVVMDLNGFKPINDSFGHDAGDDVLRIVARRIAGFAGDNLAARLGGDEFAAILTGPHAHLASPWWQRALAALASTIAEPMAVAGRVLRVTASIGVAPAQGDTPLAELLRRADLAMYQAKLAGQSHLAWSGEATSIGSRHGYGAGPDHDRCADLAASAVEFALFPVTRSGLANAGLPDCEPARRDPGDVAPAGTYRRGDPVWVYRHGDWRPGVVEGASSRAILATYRCGQGRGTAVDTMGAEYVLSRPDTHAERGMRDPGVAA